MFTNLKRLTVAVLGATCLVAATAHADDCATGAFCLIPSPLECLWLEPVGGCAAITNRPVERRLCEMGLLLDGDVSDALANGARVMLDRVPDADNQGPGSNGFEEQPRENGDPNGFNFARAVVLFMPDSDPLPGIEHDNSFLYLGFDIADFVDEDGFAPVPFDSNDDGIACMIAPPIAGTNDDLAESYSFDLQLCTDLEGFDPIDGNPNFIHNDLDETVRLRLRPGFLPGLINTALRGLITPDGDAQPVLSFPTSAPYPSAVPITNPTNGCVDQELQHCAAGNDVEVVIKHVESQATFGPTPELRRMGMAQLLARLRGASDGDLGDEEVATILARTSVPEIEVRKEVKCADADDSEFSTNAVALPGAIVEYRIIIRNTGNEELDVTVHDVMQAVNAQGEPVICEPLCETLSAALTSNGVTIPIDVSNAGFYDLDVNFFVDFCFLPDAGFLGAIRNNQAIRLGRLRGASVRREASACLLSPGDVLTLRYQARPDVTTVHRECDASSLGCMNAMSVSAIVPVPIALTNGNTCGFDEACDDGLYCNGQESCVLTNCTSGFPPCVLENLHCDEIADACGPPIQESSDVADLSDVADTREEADTGHDDNVATVDLLCRGFTFLKEVGFSGAADSFVSSNGGLRVPPIPPGGFEDIEFRYTVANTGNVSEEITVCDAQLCAHLDAVGASLVDCTMCSAGTNGCLTLIVPAGADDTASCVARFTSQDQLAAFLALDDGRPECAAEEGTCYRNCAEASAEAADLGGVCDGADTLVASSYATICSEVCDLNVVKEVRCLPGCVEPPGPESGWVRDPELLDVRSGACLQYRITATNISSTGTAICALRYTDCMADSNAFSGGPANIQQSGDVACASLPAAFNWECTPFDCGLSQPLLPGQKHVITFTTQVAHAASPAIDPRNTIVAEGASYCAGPPPIYFDCPVEAGVGIDVQHCGIAVTKEATCDDPRGPGAAFDPDVVDALPGSTIGFRIQVCNTGEVELTEVELQDTLDCGWPVIPGSILADVDGADVTGCICTNGPCATIDDLNGRRDLTACLPAAIGTNSCLTITFEAQVPADFDTTGTPFDCSNDVTVSVFSDGCSPDGAACAEDSDGVDVNVKIPDVACTKSVCADANADGDCDDAGDHPFTDFLELPCNLNFPIQLIYRGEVTNTGETPLDNVRICDPQLAVDAAAAGMVVGPCDLCANAGTLPPGASTAGFCTITVPTYAAWQKFAAADGASPDCYANTMEAQAEVPADGMCMRGADRRVTSSCSAEACIAPPCQIAVEKGVRCIDGCVTREVLGSSWFVDAPPGDCDGNGVLDLRDFLLLAECFDGPETLPDPGDDRMTTSACLAAFDFDGDGDVDFRDYSRFEAMAGGGVQSLPVAAGATVEFEVKVTNTGDEPICALEICDELVGSIGLCPDPVTTAELVSSNGTTICPILPAPPYPVDGSCFEINIMAACGVPMQPGDNLVLHIGAQVESDAAGVIRNDVCVRCSPGDEANCATAPATYCGDEVCDAATLPVLACDFEVGKNVTCGEPRAADGDVSTTGLFDMNVAALPGSSNGFLITVCNTGDADICTIGIAEELLDCENWFVPGSVQATIAGSDVTGCLCPGGACATITDLDGRHGLADCAGQCLGAGECLSITFEVVVPADFDSTGAPVDCRNTVVITGYTDICSPDANPCPQHTGSATIDVQPPAVACDKVVCADVDTDGVCDDAFASTNSLRLPCAIDFPFDLIYTITATNPGDTPLVGVTICDQALVADALAAGFEVGPCDFCNDPACAGDDDTCTPPFNLAVGAANAVTCTITVPDRAAWIAFAGTDDDLDTSGACYVNESDVSGNADPEAVCTDHVDPRVNSTCAADVCLEPKCVPIIICPDDQLGLECPACTTPECTGTAGVQGDCDVTTIGYRDVSTNGPCPTKEYIERTWFVEAECDARAECVQIIEVLDTEPPWIECPESITIDCTEEIPPLSTNGVKAGDACGPVEVVCHDVGTTGMCPAVIHRICVAIDSCGLKSACDYSITVVDTNGPEIACPPDVDFECVIGSTGVASAIDDCDPDPDITFTDISTNACPHIITRIWTATDDCGNPASCPQVIRVDDTVPPVIDDCPTNEVISCDDVLFECDTSGLIAHDNCGPVHRTCRDLSTTGTCEAVVEREYVVTDDCGNSNSCLQYVTIVDTNGPELTCPPDIDTLGCLDSTHPDETGWPIVGPDCNSVGMPTWEDEPSGACPTTIIRTWTVRDICGNPSTCEQLIPVDDEVPPDIECPSNGIIDCSAPFPPVSTNGVEASDNCALDNVQCFDLGTTGTCTEVSLRECVATDLCENTDSCRYTITRVDTTGPEITCPPDVSTIGCNDSTHPDDTGWPTADDDCNSTGVPTWVDEPSGTCPTIITRTWTVLDECDNPSSCTQKIPVDDKEPPDIVCPADFEWNCDEPLPDCTTDGVIAVDSCGLVRVECMGDVPGGVTEPTCTSGTLGFENITHNNAGDAAIGESQFFVDVTGNGSTVTFTFRNEGPLPSVITEIYFDNGSLLGIATINDAPPGVDYVQDGSPPNLPGGNLLVPPFEVTEGFLAEPSAPPAMSGVGPGESVGIVFNILPGKTLQDVLDELADGTLRIGIRGQAFASGGSESFVNTRCNESCTETIVRKYRAIDDCDNVSTCGQMITLVDDLPPVIEECPTDAFISCADEAPACDTSGVIAHDNCGPVHRSCHDVTIPGNCPQEYTIERTYTVTDNCGNFATCGQTIHVEDQEAPDLVCPEDTDCTCTTGWKIIDFETDGFVPLPAGFRVDGYLPGLGVFVQTNNAVPGHPDLAITFNSANPTGNDPDLVTPGYHPTNTVAYGNVLIIAEYDTDTNPPDSLVDDPNDEGGRPAGWIDMTFDDVYTAAELVICDTDQGETTGTVQFFDGAVQLSALPIAVLGDNSIQTITYSGAEFNRLRVNMPGSGSIPEIRLLPVCVPDCDTSAMPTATDNCDPEVDVYCIDVGTTGVGGGAGGSTYTWKWQPGDYPGSVALSNQAGTWDKVAASYAPTLQRLVWEVTFADQNSDAITVVVNNGPNPTGIGGVYVMFYFDATDPANPRLTAYVYNGRADRTSWRDGDPETPGDQPGDLIASSLTDSGFIHELSVTDIAGKRIFRFDIDVGAINAHVPLWPNPSIPYYGAGFDGGIAMWLASFDQLTTSYSAGRLTQWQYYKSAYFDTCHLKADFECEESRIERKCFATDDCGNVNTCGYSVIIDECVSCACTLDGDTTPPVINCPDDVVVACGDSTDPGDTGMATATDECDPFVTITFEDSDPAARDTVIIRTWYAEDECGNISSCQQSITIGDGSNAIVFHETFNGYTYFPNQHPAGDPINAGLPLKSEGASESWYGGRFEVGDGGTINSDLAVQQAGGDGNNTPVGRVEDDAGMLFHIDTSVYTQVTLTFRWRMFDAGSSDRFVAGYYVGDIPFAGDTPDGENDDLVHRFTTDGPGWEQWSELVRANTGNWKWETLTLPAGQKDVWVAFWVDNGHGDFAKIDDIKVIVSCP